MIRQSRTLLLLGLIAVGGVVALGMMAQRYTTLVENRREGGDGDAAAEHWVRAYVQVRLELHRSWEAARSEAHDAAGLRERLRGAFDEALAEHGLDRVQYGRLESMFRSWRAGRAHVLPEGFRAAFERHGAPLRDLRTDAYDPLTL